MSEFHRMITYLYLYEGNHKTRNIGFAKIEKRDRRCLVEIHMKNTGHSHPDLPVYFYARNESGFPGILLGHLNLFHGTGDFKELLDTEDICGTGFSLSDVKGIYLPLSETAMLVSQWDDGAFSQGRFLEYADSGLNNSQDNADSSCKNSLLDSAGSSRNNFKDSARSSCKDSLRNNAGSALNPSPAPAPAVSAGTTSESLLEYASRAIRNSIQSSNSGTDSHSVSESPFTSGSSKSPSESSSAPGSAESLSEPPDLKAAEAAPAADPSSSIQDEENWELKWQFILENFPVMTPFAGDEDTICVRLELKDLRLLPKSFWYLGNNSFLLHGFFNYRHLILGMKTDAGHKRWFLGIPGIFQNPERVMAILFGFTDFSSEKPSGTKTGSFGYWLHYLSN